MGGLGRSDPQADLLRCSICLPKKSEVQGEEEGVWTVRGTKGQRNVGPRRHTHQVRHTGSCHFPSRNCGVCVQESFSSMVIEEMMTGGQEGAKLVLQGGRLQAG